MNPADTNANPTVFFVPLNPGCEAALSICIAVMADGDRRTVPVVRTTSAATAYLGAVCDGQQRPLNWVELWFPYDEADGRSPLPAGASESPSPHLRWFDQMRRWEKSSRSGLLTVGWECGLPRPLVLQTDSLSWLQLNDPVSGLALQFCRDDAQLARAGLPPYSSTSAVFLSGDGLRFFRAAGASTTTTEARVEELLPKDKPLVVISTTGRSLGVRRAAPLGLAVFADLLAGTPLTLEPQRHDAVRLSFNGAAGGANAEILTNPHRLLLRARAGRNEWTAEIIALKARLLCLAIQSVREETDMACGPFLSLSEHAFAVRFGLAGPPLQLWDFEVMLHATGCAALRRAGGTQFAWRAMRESQMPPAYEKRTTGEVHDREVECRLRLVARQESEIVVEATLGCSDKTSLGGMIACLYLPLATGRLVLWGRLSRDDSLAREETRFRSFATQFDPATTAELERMQGFVWGNVLFKLIPAAGFGDDFHSLGVLAVRLLLTSDARQLPSTLDTVFSVVERLGDNPTDRPLPLRIRDVFEREPRFRELLHPGRAVAYPISENDAMACLGESGWWELLAFVLRLFPTGLPEAFCRAEDSTNLGVFPRAFDEALHASQALNRRLTDLVMPTETLNRRVRTVIESIRRSSVA